MDLGNKKNKIIDKILVHCNSLIKEEEIKSPQKLYELYKDLGLFYRLINAVKDVKTLSALEFIINTCDFEQDFAKSLYES